MGFGNKTIGTIAAGFGWVIAFSGAASAGVCDPDSLSIRGDWGQARFTVEIADDADERATGLMDREQMASAAGMLFVYDRPQSVSFWMRNTLIPLDMLFIDPTGRVTSIAQNAIPLDETPIPGGQNIQYVLEVNGGMTEALGINVGSEILSASINQNIALWPCGDQ